MTRLGQSVRLPDGRRSIARIPSTASLSRMSLSTSLTSSSSLSSLPTASPLKTLRYEDAVDGIPPLAVTSINRKPSSTSLLRHESTDAPPPRVAKPRSSAVSCDVKRDSGIATSLSTAGRASYAESHASSAAGGAAREPALPTIVVQDDENSSDATFQSLSPSTSLQSVTDFHSLIDSSPAPKPIAANLAPGTFHTDASLLPVCSLTEIDLEDLRSDRVAFSHRGSLLYGGKKMQELIAAQADSTAAQSQYDATVSPIRSNSVPNGNPSPAHTRPITSSTQSSGKALTDGAPKTGLVAGRRKPSIQMLQAALHDGRVLSAEEISFSLKVRSMYEHGTDHPDPTVSSDEHTSTGPGTATDDQSPPASPTSTDPTDVTRQGARSALGFIREPMELAGGIEDWGDVRGSDVDRYGFIQPKQVTSRSSGVSSPVPGQGVQRVATSLQLAADPSRSKRRSRLSILSPSRSSRSLPPRPDSRATDGRGARSTRSTSSADSTRRRANPFRSRNQKTLDEASDMLTFTPGLTDIAEQDENGHAASPLKRREWSREEKWQKMARPVGLKATSKGGGMTFAFDTADSKVINRTWKGIPDRWRATVWHSFLSTSAARRGSNVPDAQLIQEFHRLQEQSSADDVQIDMDVPRTVNMHIMFRRRYRGGQRLLFRVLHAISLYFLHIGYVQGMASLAATLLCYYDEENAFVMMVRLWQLRGLEQLFTTGFEGLLTALNQFEKEWLGRGDVACKLEELGVSSTAYGTRWYLTLFNMSIPFSAQLRVWDVFMLLGDADGSQDGSAFGGADLDVLHATSAAIIDATREIILDSDFENAMKVLTSFIPIRDEDLLMRVARTEWRLRKKRAGVRA